MDSTSASALEIEGGELTPEQAIAAWKALALAVRPLCEARAREDAAPQKATA